VAPLKPPSAAAAAPHSHQLLAADFVCIQSPPAAPALAPAYRVGSCDNQSAAAAAFALNRRLTVVIKKNARNEHMYGINTIKSEG
jgi:hypothetical protein